MTAGSTQVGWRCRSLWSEGVVRGGGGALKSRRRWNLCTHIDEGRSLVTQIVSKRIYVHTRPKQDAPREGGEVVQEARPQRGRGAGNVGLFIELMGGWVDVLIW